MTEITCPRCKGTKPRGVGMMPCGYCRGEGTIDPLTIWRGNDPRLIVEMCGGVKANRERLIPFQLACRAFAQATTRARKLIRPVAYSDEAIGEISAIKSWLEEPSDTPMHVATSFARCILGPCPIGREKLSFDRFDKDFGKYCDNPNHSKRYYPCDDEINAEGDDCYRLAPIIRDVWLTSTVLELAAEIRGDKPRRLVVAGYVHGEIANLSGKMRYIDRKGRVRISLEVGQRRPEIGERFDWNSSDDDAPFFGKTNYGWILDEADGEYLHIKQDDQSSIPVQPPRFDLTPKLADALMDAGADNEELLNHCRENVHCQECWVINEILKKT